MTRSDGEDSKCGGNETVSVETVVKSDSCILLIKY